MHMESHRAARMRPVQRVVVGRGDIVGDRVADLRTDAADMPPLRHIGRRLAVGPGRLQTSASARRMAAHRRVVLHIVHQAHAVDAIVVDGARNERQAALG